MKIVNLDKFDQYDVYIQDFCYENKRLFAFHDKRDLCNEEHLKIEYDYYRGIILLNYDDESIETDFFEEKNVFKLSQQGSHATLYFLNYNHDYSSVHLFKLNCRTKEKSCILTRSFKSNSLELNEGLFNVYKFVGLNDRYVFISFSIGSEKQKYSYVIDSLSREWISIPINSIINNIEQLSVINDFIIIKTGEYLTEEKQKLWETNSSEIACECLIVVETAVFIQQIYNQLLNFKPYILESFKNNISLVQVITETHEVIYHTIDFENCATTIVRYNPLTGMKSQLSFGEIYENIIISKHGYHSQKVEEDAVHLCELKTKKNLKVLNYPDMYAWIDGENLYTYSLSLNGASRINLRNSTTNDDILIAEGVIFLDLIKDAIVVIHQTGNSEL